MPRFEKWLTQVGPDVAVARAARSALGTRLKATVHFLKQAGRASNDRETSTEAVHQLRIWSRRASAAIRLFGEILPAGTTRWFKRKLKAVRRTAGQARDCDVLAARLASGGIPPIAATADHLRADRRKAEKELARARKELIRSGRFRRKRKKLLRKIQDLEAGTGNSAGARKPAGRKAYGPWCRQALVPLVDDFLTAAHRDLTRDKALHAMRIAGKRLRYALELASPALPAGVHGRLYDELSELQDRLGHVCDKIVSLDQHRKWRDETRSQRERRELADALRKQDTELAAAKAAFRRWWSPKRRAALANRWRRALRS